MPFSISLLHLANTFPALNLLKRSPEKFEACMVASKSNIEKISSIAGGKRQATRSQAAATTSARIRHLPAILYHRGDEAGLSSAQIDFSHPEALVARSRVVRDFLDAEGYASASIIDTPGYPGSKGILWPVPDPEPLVSIIIPTRDRGDLVASCVDGIRHRTAYSNLEILFVSNGSTERESLAVFERLTKENSRIRILSSAGPFNYAKLTNHGARDAQGEILFLLNNAIEVNGADWPRGMVSLAVRPEVGAVGAKLLYQDGTIQHAGIVLGPNGAAMHQYRFSDRNDPGYRVLWTPFAELYHLESVSRGRDDATPVSQARSAKEWRFLRAKWKGVLENEDPFHNPNLLFEWDHLETPLRHEGRNHGIPFLMDGLLESIIPATI